MIRPANEKNKELFVNGYLPIIISLIILIASVILDLKEPGVHWTQRSGAVIIVLGAYVVYIDVKQSMKLINGNLYIQTKLAYKVIAVTLIVIGTLVSGYGDLLI